MDYSVIIPNWNGAAVVARALASVEASMRGADGEGEVLVVDDASEDGSVAIIEERFPGARLLRNQRNLGFAATVNRGLREARGGWAVLLNNDVVIRADFLRVILAPFEAADGENLFAVSAKTLQWDTGEPNHVCMNGRWRGGWVQREWSAPAERAPALFVQAGACAARQDRALELGGLRELYRPGYWEDYDLSYRAAKRGWPSLYEPSAVAYHLGKASLERRYGSGGVEALRLRNEFLFHWANLDDPSLIASHAWGLVRRLSGDVARGRVASLKAFARAVARLPEALARRRRPARVVTTTDTTLLQAPHPGRRSDS